jgi:hypothetical protein
MPQQAPESCVDHYTFWEVEPIYDFEREVTLEDRFHKGKLKARVRSVEFLGNPARKKHGDREIEDVHHPKVHLLAYGLRERIEAPADPALVRNQFTAAEGAEWVLGDAEFLLIPARKEHLDQPAPTTPPPQRVDHFLCYRVNKAPRPVFDVASYVRDQFGDTDLLLGDPVFLGVPVNKNGEGLLHPEIYLAIYEMRHGGGEPARVNTSDQLYSWHVSALGRKWIGVPSHNLADDKPGDGRFELEYVTSAVSVQKGDGIVVHVVNDSAVNENSRVVIYQNTGAGAIVATDSGSVVVTATWTWGLAFTVVASGEYWLRIQATADTLVPKASFERYGGTGWSPVVHYEPGDFAVFSLSPRKRLF